jgi:hypothetical protein
MDNMRTFWTSCCDVEWWGVDWRRRLKRRQAASFPSVFFVMRQLMGWPKEEGVYNSFSQKRILKVRTHNLNCAKRTAAINISDGIHVNKGGCVGSRAGTQAIQQTEIFRLRRESNSKFSAVQTIDL